MMILIQWSKRFQAAPNSSWFQLLESKWTSTTLPLAKVERSIILLQFALPKKLVLSTYTIRLLLSDQIPVLGSCKPIFAQKLSSKVLKTLISPLLEKDYTASHGHSTLAITISTIMSRRTPYLR